MQIRNHTLEDYPTFCQWWAAWEWPPIPYEFLPQHSIVVYDDVPICAVFLYRTDTPILWAENYISCKIHPKRVEALKLLIDNIAPASKELEAKAVMSAVNHPVLARKLKQAGFMTGDANLTNYILAV